MHWKIPQSLKRKNHYSARHMAKPVTFFLNAPEAQQVSLIGDFNRWDPQSTAMIRQPDGVWRVQADLTHGHHRYLFVVDGQLVPDPRAHGSAMSRRFGKVSVLAVS